MRTIAHISDLHFGRTDPKVCCALLDDLHELAPSLVAVSGDLTQRAKPREFREAARFLEALPGPWLAVPGNHDIPLYDIVRRTFSPLARFKKYICTDLNPVFVDDEIMVLGLNTARSMTIKNGRVSAAQIARIRERLLHEPKDRTPFKVLVTHHPFVPTAGTPSSDLVQRGELALAALEEWGADLLLAGHLHRSYTDDVRAHNLRIRRSILIAQAGTAISTRHRGEPNGYNLVTIERGRVSIELRDFDGTHFRPSRTILYRCDGGEWQTSGVEAVTASSSPSAPA